MRVKNIWTGRVFEAEWRTDHPATSYGQPILVLKETDHAVDFLDYFKVDEDEEEEG